MRNYQPTGQDKPSECADVHIEFATRRSVWFVHVGGWAIFLRRRNMFEPLARRLHAWHMRNVTRRKLSLLDTRLLADLGIERDQIGDFVARLNMDGERK